MLTLLASTQSAILYIKGRGKWGSLNGKLKEPSAEDPSSKKWDVENSTIFSKHMHSMQSETNSLFLRTDKMIWWNLPNRLLTVGMWLKSMTWKLKQKFDETN